MSNIQDDPLPEDVTETPAGNEQAAVPQLLVQAAVVVGLLIMGGVLALLGERLLSSNGAETRLTQFQSWRLICPPTSQGGCTLTQSVVRDQAAGAMAYISVEGNDPNMRIRLVVPLGIMLQSGLGFSVGDVLTQVRPFETCDPAGCLAFVALDPTVLAAFSTKQSGEVAVSIPEATEPVSVPYSLAGFKEGYAALVSANARRNSVFSFLYR